MSVRDLSKRARRSSPLLLVATLFLNSSFVFSQKSGDEKKTHYILENPEVVRLELVPRALNLGEDTSTLEKPYVDGEKVYFRLKMTNTSLFPVEVPVGNLYRQNRPILYKNGQVHEYRKQIAELTEASDETVSDFHRDYQAHLEPNESITPQRIILDDWYDDLGPGHYQISVKHRLQPGQEWIESSSITFDIVAKSKNDTVRKPEGSIR